jgi:exosortase family protein XrtF
MVSLFIITNLMQKINPILLLFLKALALYLVWYLVYELFLAKDGTLDTFLNQTIITSSVELLKLLGYTSYANQHIVCIDTRNMVSVGAPCNGLVLYALFTGFLLVMPGKLKDKLWFSVVGMSLLYMVNVLRVVALALNMWYSPQTFDFNHRYVYQLLVYVIIFLLWKTWVKRFSGLELQSNKQ